MHLTPSQSTPITIQAIDFHAGDPVLHVEAGETYSFACPPGQQWKDSWVKTGPDGFVNLLLWISGRRLKGVKCFCLCGSIGKDDKHLFAIGSRLDQYEMPASGDLYFFANDYKNAYKNNSGSINVVVTRLT
jgi:hypothetical protein